MATARKGKAAKSKACVARTFYSFHYTKCGKRAAHELDGKPLCPKCYEMAVALAKTNR